MIDLAASITSSTITTALLYPIERLKIEIQLDKDNESVAKSFDSIMTKQGVPGFYQGLSPLIIGNAFAYGIYFVAYEKLKIIIQPNQQSMMSIAQCSGLAGIIGSLMTNPFYVLQTRQSKENKPLVALTRKLIKDEGVWTLWKGIAASLILVSNPIIQFVVYEHLKKRLGKGGKQLSSLLIFLIGAISKIVATIFTYPYTLLRTRQQSKKADKNLSLTEIFKDICEKESFLGVFKGLGPKLIQTTLNSAILLMIYEKIRALLMSRLSK